MTGSPRSEVGILPEKRWIADVTFGPCSEQKAEAFAQMLAEVVRDNFGACVGLELFDVSDEIESL